MSATRTALLFAGVALLMASCPGRGNHDAHEGHDHSAGGGHDEHAGHDHADSDGHDHEGHDEGEPGIVELPEGSSVETKLAPVERRPFASERLTTGQVDYVQSSVAHVSPRVPGRVHRVMAQLGDEVRAGQAVAELDSIEIGTAKATYVQARTREDLARRTFEREKALHDERISSEREMIEAEAAWQEAHSATETAAQALRLYGLDEVAIRGLGPGAGPAMVRVTAPIAGRIVEHHATVGELVTPETHLMTVGDLSRVWVWIDVPERDVAAVHVDDDVEVTSDAWAVQRFTGKVSYLTPEVDADTRTVRARIEVENTSRRLLPGMFVSVRVTDPHGAGLEGPGSLVVPATAVQRDGAESIAFVALGPRRFERRELRVGRATTEWIEILDGLAEGEQVVVEGAFILKSEAARHQLGGGHSH